LPDDCPGACPWPPRWRQPRQPASASRISDPTLRSQVNARLAALHGAGSDVVAVSEFALYTQAAWRLTHDSNVLIPSLDVYCDENLTRAQVVSTKSVS
jgi:hypothetical protein